MKDFRSILSIMLAVILLVITPALALAEAPANPMKVAGTQAPAAGEETEEESDDFEDAEFGDANAMLPDTNVDDEGNQLDLNNNQNDPLELIDGVRNILLVGLDARPGESTGRSDTMMILTLDADRKVVKLTSLMRDMYVNIPGRSGNRMNAAWVYGGADLLLSTIKENFGIKVEDYVAVDFSILANVIDQMGGLTLTIRDKKQMSAINGVIKEDNRVLGISINDGLLTKTGEQLLTGKQVEGYARYRRGESDFTRTERQREVIIKSIDKLSEMSILDMTTLATTNIEKVTTNMTLADILELAPAAFALRDADVQQLRLPADGTYSSKRISGMAVLVPDLSKNKKLLEDFINK